MPEAIQFALKWLYKEELVLVPYDMHAVYIISSLDDLKCALRAGLPRSRYGDVDQTMLTLMPS